MLDSARRFLIGDPLPTSAASHERLGKFQALAVLSSDALSSVAYATEEILVVLVAAGTAALAGAPFVGLAIAALLIIVAGSYYQTIHAYPTGGGSYTVSRENLGVNASLVAGAALLIDYLLTVAVSVSAGIAAITSAFPGLMPHRVWLALAALALVALVNLRGLRESGRVFALPTYFFIVSIFTLIVVGVVRLLTGSISTVDAAVPVTASESWLSFRSLSLFMVLRAFASGCSALTGVEAISNGVTVFRKPEAHNASRTLLWMAGLLVAMFLGLTLLAHQTSIIPHHGETVVSQIASAVLGRGFPYYMVQAATALILLLAANTSFSDFPRLANLIARDRFLPTQFTFVGDRLVFAVGIQVLAILAGVLIVAFGAQTHALIPLYAVGVFVSFTLSQSGMVIHWLKLRTAGWQRSVVFNGLGALTTAVVLIVVTISKFAHGAWITFLLIVVLVALFHGIHRHYGSVSKQLSLDQAWPTPIRNHTIIVPVDTMHRGVVKAIHYAQTIHGNLKVVTVETDAECTEGLCADWHLVFPDLPLVMLPSPYRSVIEPLVAYAREFMAAQGDYVTFILPEFVPAHPWQAFLHNQAARVLRRELYATYRDWYDRYVVITGVRFFLHN
ncbi:MAG: APC family permease [Anaerolineae bacterium]|nr:APC family permease [Anaerolineae bacterium]